MRARLPLLRALLLPAAGVILAYGLVRASRVPPVDVGCPFMANCRGDLRWEAVRGVVEMLVLYAVLRPWSYDASMERAFAAWAMFTPWAVIYLAISIHGGPIIGAHALWLLMVDAALFVTTCVSAVGRWRKRRTVERHTGRRSELR